MRWMVLAAVAACGGGEASDSGTADGCEPAECGDVPDGMNLGNGGTCDRCEADGEVWYACDLFDGDFWETSHVPEEAESQFECFCTYNSPCSE